MDVLVNNNYIAVRINFLVLCLREEKTTGKAVHKGVIF